MAITRKQIREIFPEATDEQVSSFLNTVHDETDAIRDELDAEKGKLKTAQATISTLTTERDTARNDLESLKNSNAAEKSRDAKKAAVIAYFKDNGMTEDAAKLAVGHRAVDFDSLELENGKIKDSKALDALISGEFSGLISTSTTSGTSTRNPGATGTGKQYSTKEEIYKITDTAERQKAIAENIGLFGGE